MGIDPGKTGAVVMINESEEIIHRLSFDCDESIEGNADKVEAAACIVNDAFDNSIYTCLEKVHSMPKQGVCAVWTFAENFSMWKTLLIVNRIPFELVTPQRWMKGLIVKSDHAKKKKRGLTVCRRKWPGDAFFKLEKHDGRADAALMAVHIKRKIMGNR